LELTGFGGFQIVRDVFNITSEGEPEQDYACFFKRNEKKKIRNIKKEKVTITQF
jgi:hypothetical protein